MSDAGTPVPLEQLTDLYRLGQPLPFSLLDPQGRLLLAQDQTIHSERQLQALIERGACVAAEEVRAVRAARGQGMSAPVRARNLFDRWEEHIWRLDQLTRELLQGQGSVAAWREFAVQHVALVDREPEVALFMAVRQDDRRFALYGLTHALHTATTGLLAARQLGWTPVQALTLTAAALTMNVAISELQSRMAQQNDPPTRRQLEQIRAHPQASADLLRAIGLSDAAWLQAVEEHHEQRAGGGYPKGTAVTGDLPRLLRAADVLTAKISPRELRPAMLPQLAARQLFQDEAGGPLAGGLIKAIGLYPPGDIVRLESGEVGIVARRAAPPQGAMVLVLRDARGRTPVGPVRHDTAQAGYGISGPVPDRSGLPRVMPEQVYGVLEP
jgi:HD-GYP domain-containing protein (c-di-GMP phosphodiesterase class II)